MLQTGDDRGAAVTVSHCRSPVGAREIARHRRAADRETPGRARRNASNEARATRHNDSRTPMAIELEKDVRDRAIASLQRYF